MEPLDNDQILDDSGLPPDLDSNQSSAEESTSAAGTPDVTGLQTQLSQLKEELENRDKRLRDTQSDWHRLQADRLEAQRQADYAYRQAQDHARKLEDWQRWAQNQQQTSALNQPELSEAEREALLTNPEYLNGKMYDVGRRAYETAMSQVTPALQSMQRQIAESRAAMEPVYEQAAHMAAYQAEQNAVSSMGMAPEDFRGYYNYGLQALWAAAQNSAQQVGGDPVAKYNSLRTNPQAVAMAVQMARTQAGAYAAPAYTPPTPPSAGNNQTRTPGRRGGKSREQLDIEKMTGREFTPAEADNIRARARANAQAHIARNGGSF